MQLGREKERPTFDEDRRGEDPHCGERHAVLESEARLAAAELGLDPGLGVLHKDTPNRDSLACNLMEPVRPLVDAYVFDWMNRGPLRREWFFEQANGNCRLMGSFAAQLSETAAAWGKAVSPYAEGAAKIFWQGRSKRSKFTFLPTRLTQTRRSLGRSGNLAANVATVPKTNPRLSAVRSKCHNWLTVLREMRSGRESRKSSQPGEIGPHCYSQSAC
jgi:CRISPR associated protein, Cas1 family